MFLSVCAFSAMDLIVKWSENYPVGEVLFFRGLCGIIPLFFFIPKERYLDFYKTSRPLLHFKRCVAGLISLSIMFLSFFTIPQGWLLPSVKDLILLSLLGILGGLANLWLTQSYKFSDVSLVTPLKYLALVFAIFFGYIIWDEVPTIKTLIGSSLVIISSIIIFRREIFYKKQVSISRHE